MIYKVKHVSNYSQKTRKQRRGKNVTKMTTYCRFYKGVKFVVVVSSISWLVSIAGMVEVEEKQLGDCCRYLMLVESYMCTAGWSLWAADVGRVLDVYSRKNFVFLFGA